MDVHFNVSLASTQASFKVDEPILVAFKVTNIGQLESNFCQYHTPFEGMANEIFQVRKQGGGDISYEGILASRIAPGPSDYTHLKPGQATSCEIDLKDGYSFDVGYYEAVFPGNDIAGLPASNAISFQIRGNE